MKFHNINKLVLVSVTGANFRAEGESEFGKCDLSYE